MMVIKIEDDRKKGEMNVKVHKTKNTTVKEDFILHNLIKIIKES